MRPFLPRQRICQSCLSQLEFFLVRGHVPLARIPRHGGTLRNQYGNQGGLRPRRRNFTTERVLRASVEHGELHERQTSRTPAQIETIVRQARQTFGETLPEDFLSSEEYAIYERLYGPPIATTLPEDVDLLGGIEEEGLPGNALMRENADGELEEVVFEEGQMEEDVEAEDTVELEELGTDEEFQGRMTAYLHLAAAATSAKPQPSEDHGLEPEEAVDEEMLEDDLILESRLREDEDVDDAVEESNESENGDSLRTHPLTAAGRYGTSPATIQIPKDTVVDPVTALLSDASNKQLAEVSHKTFGGPGLPNSTATISRPNLKQQPIALLASQPNMGEMEGNVYMAAIMPGAYVTIMSTLVEIRKRLGSKWLRELIQKPDGPRVLDAGAGGAGVLAWREMLRAEWELMHPGKALLGESVPYGKSTVVTGSAALRNRASHLLDDTTFIPRLPDYDPSRDHPSLESNNPQPRKQYDVILAPHTLWNFKEDYMRKNQVQNFWSLLDPNGGVLALIEKGVPRGFELIAGARETLLKYHVASPGAEDVEHTIEDASENRYGPKETGMIIAPCTNHGKCPMYITAGRSQGRKDYCHFSQRYIRPPYLQRILGGRDRNHEDISFSYVALQRGIDQRQTDHILQGQPATEAAFAGYEEVGVDSESADEQIKGDQSGLLGPSTLSLPRAILPPIKRRGHVVLDLCTPSGTIERWTVPRSFSKQAYRDARKSKWGDLWALGAKTRVSRNIRVGLKKVKTRSQDILDAGAEDMEDVEEAAVPREPKAGLSTKPRKGKHKRKVIADDY